MTRRGSGRPRTKQQKSPAIAGSFRWLLQIAKWSGPGSNRRHMDFQSIALPTELPDLRTLFFLKGARPVNPARHPGVSPCSCPFRLVQGVEREIVLLPSSPVNSGAISRHVHCEKPARLAKRELIPEREWTIMPWTIWATDRLKPAQQAPLPRPRLPAIFLVAASWLIATD